MKSLLAAIVRSTRLRIASSFVGAFLIFRNFINTATTSETVERDFSKSLSDLGTATDAPSLSFQKSIADSMTATDDIDGDATLLDENNINFEKFRQETIAVAQSGLLVNQNFIDTNLYFAEDYVGESRSL